ncbi:uncharacterized protein LOC107982516 isoform X1 [Anolis carolinensis]|uniref:uncharacterized protein LOC107982516 isoform X1 n=1 Tax=Anolis carolinensis TaxID=28377 RepID=UPI0007DB7D5E|nr:PREDICTED: uncharacterized protein LOC107982516 isoform X1 [Anolis carolinensis]|eukprot:XP_016847400.1 PREDICTED: uncharacterized protein LOC107982516 isoform X1 [Anolis carolinensis]
MENSLRDQLKCYGLLFLSIAGVYGLALALVPLAVLIYMVIMEVQFLLFPGIFFSYVTSWYNERSIHIKDLLGSIVLLLLAAGLILESSEELTVAHKIFVIGSLVIKLYIAPLVCHLLEAEVFSSFRDRVFCFPIYLISSDRLVLEVVIFVLLLIGTCTLYCTSSPGHNSGSLFLWAMASILLMARIACLENHVNVRSVDRTSSTASFQTEPEH